MEAISSFSGDHRFLSNFYPCVVTYRNVEYPTVEHAYQAAKTKSKREREHIRNAASPGEAKRRGQKVTLRPDWEKIKIKVMRQLLLQKFGRPLMASRLLATSTRPLIEGNTWKDRFWGVCKGKGQNILGILLMQIRSLIREIVGSIATLQ